MLSLIYTAVLATSTFSPFDSPEFCLQIITPTCNTTFSYIDEINAQVRPLISKLVRSSFFTYFKLDLDKQCKFWNAQHFCATKNCAVETLPESKFNWTNVGDDLRPSKLGKIERSPGSSDLSESCEDLDYCDIDDDHNCVYVDLVANPERFTGYGGTQSFDVWKAIYSENCFPNTNPMSMAADSEPEHCVEKNLFYRMISGLHASIAVHLSSEYLDLSTGEFKPNLQVFMERVGKFNDRLSNIYFNYALVSQAMVKLGEIVSIPEYIKNNSELQSQHELIDNDSFTSSDYTNVISQITEKLGSETLFETHRLFDPQVVDPQLKNDFRMRFKNVSAIMDCVGCDRCRMWGKLQTIGYGTALKVLFDLEDPNTQHLLKFRRIELVALFNTFDRLSKSVAAINNFKTMYLVHLEDVAAGRAVQGDFEPQHGKGIEFPFFIPSKLSQESTEDTQSDESINDGGSIKIKEKKKKQGMNEELSDVFLALKFLWRSYLDFPKNLYKICAYYASGWWNVYIGKSIYIPKSALDTSSHDEL